MKKIICMVMLVMAMAVMFVGCGEEKVVDDQVYENVITESVIEEDVQEEKVEIEETLEYQIYTVIGTWDFEIKNGYVYYVDENGIESSMPVQRIKTRYFNSKKNVYFGKEAE